MPNIAARVRQIHHAYLETEFQVEYYTTLRDRTSRYAKHFDFLIGLGAAGSGGSGLGILGDARFAILCGILTSVSVILAIAKSTYDWQGRIAKSTELLGYYRPIALQYNQLIDDLNYNKKLDSEYEALHLKLRADTINAPVDPYPALKEKDKKSIKKSVRNNIDRTKWWTGGAGG